MNLNNFEPNHSGFDQPPQYSIDHQPPIIQEDLNQKLISDEFMIEQRNELFKSMESMFEEFRQREQAANLSTHTSEPSRRFNFIFYDDDDDDDEETTIPLHPEDSLVMGNEDLNTIPKKESDEFIKSSVKDLVPIPSESEDTSLSDSKCDLSSCKNNSMSGNPTPSSDSESTTTHSDYSLSNFEAFYFDDDHIEGKSSGSTSTHSDFSLPEYDSFIFDLSIDPFPLVDRSVSHHEEFVNELTHIIPSPEYDCFYFDIETDSGELTILFKENISKDSTKEFTSLELNDFPFLLSDCDSIFSEEYSEFNLLVLFPFGNKDKVSDPGISEKTFSPTYVSLPFKDRQYLFLTYVVRILLLYFTYPVVSHFLLSSGSEDTILTPAYLLFIFLIIVQLSCASMFI
uniref:Uncharacterized protein n=1 Tax=Tanacetum cinerariifolium TaxID=118510 RepID=A0A6L2J592_TANCI|nr:hypothetical protein [Tanacetum cinerariifolium]